MCHIIDVQRFFLQIFKNIGNTSVGGTYRYYRIKLKIIE